LAGSGWGKGGGRALGGWVSVVTAWFMRMGGVVAIAIDVG
jgi:hypothetical protein